MKDIPCMPLNQQLKETVPCGSDSFPIQYYVDDLSDWSNQTVPLHWHPEQEFFQLQTELWMSKLVPNMYSFLKAKPYLSMVIYYTAIHM